MPHKAREFVTCTVILILNSVETASAAWFDAAQDSDISQDSDTESSSRSPATRAFQTLGVLEQRSSCPDEVSKTDDAVVRHKYSDRAAWWCLFFLRRRGLIEEGRSLFLLCVRVCVWSLWLTMQAVFWQSLTARREQLS